MRDPNLCKQLWLKDTVRESGRETTGLIAPFGDPGLIVNKTAALEPLQS